MFDKQLGRRRDGSGGGSLVERLLDHAPPVLEPTPVEIGGNPPTAAMPALLELLKPGGGGGNGSRRVEPAQAIVNNLLRVLCQLVKNRTGQRRRLRRMPPQINWQIADQQRTHGKRQFPNCSPDCVQRYLFGKA